MLSAHWDMAQWLRRCRLAGAQKSPRLAEPESPSENTCEWPGGGGAAALRGAGAPATRREVLPCCPQGCSPRGPGLSSCVSDSYLLGHWEAPYGYPWEAASIMSPIL